MGSVIVTICTFLYSSGWPDHDNDSETKDDNLVTSHKHRTFEIRGPYEVKSRVRLTLNISNVTSCTAPHTPHVMARTLADLAPSADPIGASFHLRNTARSSLIKPDRYLLSPHARDVSCLRFLPPTILAYRVRRMCTEIKLLSFHSHCVCVPACLR
jgi:hypothetical protein